jgi:diguanylate cyclase (GGDEF)-like protein/PAS domain S-box-containing protein
MAGDGFYREALDHLYDGVYVVDRDRRITYWNRGAERLTGYRGEEVIGTCCWDNILAHVDEQGVGLCQGEGCPLAQAMADGQVHEMAVYLRHREGHRAPVLVRAAPTFDASGRVTGAVEIFNGNTSLATYEERIRELEEMAMLDALTGIANRRYLEMSLRAKLNEMARYDWQFGVLYCDIDRFKEVNDRHGHDVGDEVLRMVARTLAGSARPFDVVGRWGGEEFMTVVTNVDRAALCGMAERLRALVEQSSLDVGTDTVRVTISAGAVLVEPSDTLHSILRRADHLMYQSKALGRNRVSVASAAP